MRTINHRIGIYIVNPKDNIYSRYWVAKAYKKFIATCVTPHKFYTIKKRNWNRLKLSEIKDIENDINIIILPTQSYEFRLWEHSGHIIITTSFHSGNTRYSYGALNYAPLTLIRYYLLEGRILDTDKFPYKNSKPEGKALMLACFRRIKQHSIGKLYKKAVKFKISPSLRGPLLRIISLKDKRAVIFGGTDGV